MKYLVYILLMLMALPASAQRHKRVLRSAKQVKNYVQQQVVADSLQTDSIVEPDTLQLLAEAYRLRLEHLVDSIRRADSANVDTEAEPSPFYYPILTNGTLYNNPLRQQMSIDWTPQLTSGKGSSVTLTPTTDLNLERFEASNDMLSDMYIQYPWLFQQTQQKLKKVGGFRRDIQQPAPTPKVRFSEQAKLLDLENDVDPVLVQTRRPNFWTFKGNGSVQFQQSYFSDNWYQGGEKNYSALSQITLELKYDNKKKIQWENKLEFQLGFQTSQSDTCHHFKPTSNLARFTTKLGFKAAKYWYYTTQVQAYTQLVPNYKTNSKSVTTDFLSPLNMTVSVGLDYKLNLKRFSSSIVIAPLAYNLRFVDRENLVRNYGIDEGHRAKHTFGPNITFNYTWKIINNVTWNARLYWFSNFDYTDIQFENTFTFTINKYLNTKFYFYPKFDDSATKYKGKHDYFMFKEWLSLGVAYSI